MDRKEVEQLCLAYDFKKRGIASFCRKYTINHKTVKRILLRLGVDHNRQAIKEEHKRDSMGRFSLFFAKRQSLQKSSTVPVEKLSSQQFSRSKRTGGSSFIEPTVEKIKDDSNNKMIAVSLLSQTEASKESNSKNSEDEVGLKLKSLKKHCI